MDDSAVDELRATGSYGPHLKEYRRRDGTRLTVEVTGAVVSREPLSWVTFVRDPAAQPDGEMLAESAGRLAALAGELARDVTVTDVARTLTRHVRQAMGAIGATIMEMDLAGQSMRPVLVGRAGHRGDVGTDRRGPGQGGHEHGRRARRGGRPGPSG
jgi:hypothetical protein